MASKIAFRTRVHSLFAETGEAFSNLASDTWLSWTNRSAYNEKYGIHEPPSSKFKYSKKEEIARGKAYRRAAKAEKIASRIGGAKPFVSTGGGAPTSFIESIRRDKVVQLGSAVGKKAYGAGKWAGNLTGDIFRPHGNVARVGRAALGLYHKTPRWMKRVGGIGGIAVGAAAMLGVGILKGMMNSSKEAVYDRYMQDARFSRNMLFNSRVGSSYGTSNMLNRDGTQGLSLAMSRTRHG